MKRVLISGAGIAGLTLANCLADSGWQVNVVEKAEGERKNGYMITFFGNGWKVAEKIKILNPIEEIRYPAQEFQYVDNSGKPYFNVRLDLVRKGFGQEYTYLRRPDLEHILLERTKEKSVNIKYSTQIVEINQTPNSASVKLQNGDINSYDLVVGADGVHSGVRKMIFGEEQQFSRYLGFGMAAFQTMYREEIGNSIKIFQEPNRSAIYYPVSKKTMDCVFLFPCNNTERVPKENYKNILIDTYVGSKWINQDVIQGIPNESIGFFDVLKQIEMENWTRNRVCLVGDACACLSPFAGQGASMAILEAFVLSNMLENSSTVEEGLLRYESILKSDIARRQAQARSLANRFVSSSVQEMAWYRWITHMEFSSLLVGRTANGFKGRIHQI
jgi:2-polyprenyl-6-methoxyphenol hydroxylase-like FAD-dependent oxidoreductase